jgi:Domain of unknown function (DUF4326)
MNIKPQRVIRNRKDGSAQNSKSGLPVKYVGRPTKWGNPFKAVKVTENKWSIKLFLIEDWEKNMTKILKKNTKLFYDNKEEAFADATKCYEIFFEEREYLHFFLDEIRGKDLACFCPSECSCHVDFLLKIANNL